MTGQNREDLIICIENAAAFISGAIGYETVSAAFKRCGICDLADISGRRIGCEISNPAINQRG